MYEQLYRTLLLPTFLKARGRRTLQYWAKAEESQWWSRTELEMKQVSDARQLFEHTVTTCAYYQETWRAQGLDPRQMTELADLRKWPLLTRQDIREHRLRLRSSAPLKRLAKSTGGSSGEPLHFDLDLDSNDRRTAMMYRGYGWAGAAPGTRQLLVWGVPLGNVPRWKRWKMALHQRLDHQLLLNCFDFTPERMPQHIARINRYRAQAIIAYTNPLYELARFAEANQLSVVSPQSIVVGAEKLHDFQREVIERVFQAPVFETYGSREFMLIGAECPEHHGLHLSMENLIVEIVDDNGQPTPAGEAGNVVVTDLFNYGMPFIRYVTGDRAVAGFDMCPCGRGLPLLKKVVGRQLDMLELANGRLIPGEFFPHLMKDFPAIRRFQVEQQSAGRIVIRLMTAGGLTVSERERLLSEVRQCAGANVEIELELVSEIPLTAAGKHRVVVRSPAMSPTQLQTTNEQPACGATL